LAVKHDDLSSGKMKPDRDLETSSNSTLGCLGIWEEVHSKLKEGNVKCENVLRLKVTKTPN
jgi:hypothetical protein